MPKTKIICTLGPASSTETVLRGMARAGMSIARLNLSHGTHAEHLHRIDKVRAMNKKNGCCVQILLDLEGPRIRTGHLKDHQPVLLKKNQLLTLTTKSVLGDERVQHVDFRGSFSFLRKGLHVFIDDGNIDLQVVRAGTHTVVTRALAPYLLKEQKGINIPDAELPFRGLSQKDKADIEFAVRHRADFIAQSFVRTKEDVLNVRRLIGNRLPACKIVSKIENRKGIRNLESILKVSDGLMIARGDLGISMPIYEVPLIQKQIIRMCNFSDRFAVTATQMLESMTTNRKPTRAEVSDVANAILDRTDYVMLSGETAVGKYPVETVRMMRQIIDFTEKPPAFIFAE